MPVIQSSSIGGIFISIFTVLLAVGIMHYKSTLDEPVPSSSSLNTLIEEMESNVINSGGGGVIPDKFEMDVYPVERASLECKIEKPTDVENTNKIFKHLERLVIADNYDALIAANIKVFCRLAAIVLKDKSIIRLVNPIVEPAEEDNDNPPTHCCEETLPDGQTIKKCGRRKVMKVNSFNPNTKYKTSVQYVFQGRDACVVHSAIEDMYFIKV